MTGLKSTAWTQIFLGFGGIFRPCLFKVLLSGNRPKGSVLIPSMFCNKYDRGQHRYSTAHWVQWKKTQVTPNILLHHYLHSSSSTQHTLNSNPLKCWDNVHSGRSQWSDEKEALLVKIWRHQSFAFAPMSAPVPTVPRISLIILSPPHWQYFIFLMWKPWGEHHTKENSERRTTSHTTKEPKPHVLFFFFLVLNIFVTDFISS